MISDYDMKKLYDQALQGLKEQSMSEDGSNSSTIRETNSPEQSLQVGDKAQADSSIVNWETRRPGRSSGSSQPLRTGAGDRRRNNDEE